MTLDEAVTRLSDAMGFEVELVKGEPGTTAFAIEAADPKDWALRLSVFVELREKLSGGTEAVIAQLGMEPRDWSRTEAITKTAVRELPFEALTAVGVALLESGPLGTAASAVAARPAIASVLAAKPGPRAVNNEFFERVAEVARYAAGERQRLGRHKAPSVEAYVADKLNYSPDAVKNWLKQARRLGYLEPGELRNPKAFAEAKRTLEIADVPPERQFSTYIDDEDDQ